ncbi:PASTA domain-containing protein [Streptomyces sp. NPDC087851]|uniref:PASTA domain-containing protein n=1 Tax=Streptomyces sp. NPDC087851 TaxID=3365810 RepID=UPI00380B27C7
MTGHPARSSDGRSGDTHFEQELVTALNDFANTSPAPQFDAAGIQRRVGRKRVGLIAAVVAAIAVAGGGTALATVAGGGSDAPAPAAVTATTDPDAATLLYGDIRIELAGAHPDDAKAVLQKAQLKLGTVGKAKAPNCKPGSVIGVDPHSPATVANGDTVNLTLCAG